MGLASLALAAVLAQPTTASECPADLDLNGVVDGDDIAILLGFWSQPVDLFPPADINRDGSINGGDLAILLSGWGDCPGACQTEFAWQPGFGYQTGAPDPWGFGVYALKVQDEDAANVLYVGGNFSEAGAIPANNIARWDGTTWSAMGAGFDGSVHAIEVFDDGSGPAIYAAGDFTTADGQPARSIAKWTGLTWMPLGDGLDGWVRTLEVFDDGSGPALYVGGSFETAGGLPAGMVARWDGMTWSAVGDGFSGGPTWNGVYDLHVHDEGLGDGPSLYAGGFFAESGGVATQNIARLEDGAWQPIGPGLLFSVFGLATVDQPDGVMLVAGGGGNVGCNLSGWDGKTWSVVGGCLFQRGGYCPDVCETIYTSGGCWTISSIYAPASPLFPSFVIGGGQCGAVGWTTAGFTDLSGGLAIVPQSGFPHYPLVFAWEEFDDGTGTKLIAGGPFNTAGGVAVRGLAAWDGTIWSDLGGGTGSASANLGMNNSVLAVAVFDDGKGPALYAGGSFTTAGGVEANRIAKWDGESWAPLGGGMNNTVSALAVFDDGSGPTLYAGGSFTSAGRFGANRIAKWDGESWAPLGDGMNNTVSALAVFDDGNGPALYAGGWFTTAGGVEANRIAKWDGQSWSPLGSGVNDRVSALAVFDDGTGPALYAGGWFTTAGGVEANRIAKWDGQSWAPLGGGMNNTVSALAVFDDGNGPALYAGGSFTNAGGVEANRIARWDGTSWSSLSSGVNGTVSALAVFDDGNGPALYAGGSFTNAGGVEANRIAKWDGQSWSSLGSGMSSYVSALTLFDDGNGPALYASGSFTTAGGISSSCIARWACSPTGNYGSAAGEVPEPPRVRCRPIRRAVGAGAAIARRLAA